MPSASVLPRLVLKPRRAQPFFHRHPWVFAGAIARVEGDPEPGAEVALLTEQEEFIARGLFNPHGNIRVRLYSWEENTPLDEAFWERQLDRALELRRRLFPRADESTAYRAVNSEGDGLSGLTVDRYGDWLALQFTSFALAERRELLLRLIEEKLQPRGIQLRTEQGVGESEGLRLQDGLLRGNEPPRPLFIEEEGLRYGVDLVEGQKTGFYLDQRPGRAAAAGYVDGGRVLDLFCYSGVFGIAAAVRGNAREVLAVDVSEPALLLARANAELNGVLEKFRFEQAKAFDAMEQLSGSGERFDVVILDPPRMTRRRAGLKQALRGYFQLNRMAVDILEAGGILVTCSCSGLISRVAFEEMLNSVAMRSRRAIQILEARGQSPDHPVSATCPESRYLKCYICRVV